ncbi:hypothetical protein HBI56_108130 [Parastagonospora nodorum]|nr:hypothetical protein HBI95_232290 [Parastagonospora nodorum]KAH4302565.1 hypothetical protein HBI01_087990 [Parastagonospora nodorum]KAH4311803.1 hypothetical protein HBI02_091200 [Parastagonospora nodorum]KAH4331505.1 hypothetical protein HBI00_076430 [Parastagonospora nodorum]KAH4371428.1 hypothetical protein HBH94_113760 [Parastagonospora nodorum]
MSPHRDLSASTQLEYLKKIPLYDEEKPYQVYTHVPGIPESEKTNLVFESHENVLIHDARGLEGEFSMEKQGFEFRTVPTAANLHAQTETEMNKYLKEVEDYFMTTYGADRVFVYDFRIRRNIEMTNEGEVDLNDKFTHLRPVNQVHIDHTADGGVKRIQGHMKEESDELLGQGWIAQIINVWRPLVQVIQDKPLALCDSRTVLKNDLIATDQVTRKIAGEIYYVNYNPDQMWYYLSEQKEDEVIIFKSYDSRPDAAMAPHVSFPNPHAPADAPERESVEVRALVFYKQANYM